MKKAKLVVILLLVGALAAAALQNQASWEVSFLWMTGEVPGIILLFLTATAGFIMGITTAYLLKRDSK